MTTRKKRRVALLAAVALVGVSQAALVAEWNFDNQTLINSGATAGMHDGLIYSGPQSNLVAGTAVYSTDTPAGSGYALDLTSATNYLMIANSYSSDPDFYADTFESATNFTYSLWVKNPSGTWSDWAGLACKGFENWGGDAAGKVGFEMRARNFTQSGIQVDFWNSVTAAEPAPYTDLRDGLWRMLTFTYDSATQELDLYVDGILKSTATGAILTPAPEKVLLFGVTEGSESSKQADCLYDSIQFYDHALSESEVADLYVPQRWFEVDPTSISLELVSPNTQVTGAVDVAYMSVTNMEVNVSFSNETHVGAFSVLETMPLVLTNTSPATTPIHIQFNADATAGLTNGEIASCTAVIAWNEQGSAEVTEVDVPISLTYKIVDTNSWVSLDVIGTNTASAVNPLNLSVLGPMDWVMMGQGGSSTATNEMAGADFIGNLTVVGTLGSYSGNAFQSSWTNGAVQDVATAVQGNWEAQSNGGSISFSVSGLARGDYTLRVYGAKFKANGQFTATKGAESYSQLFDEGGAVNSTYYAVFTVEFSIDAVGEGMDVVYEMTSYGGKYANVSMTAITLEQTAVAPPPSTAGELSLGFLPDGSAVVLSLGETLAGYQYGIQATDDLIFGNWSNIVTDLEGVNGALTVTNSISEADLQQFYRAFLQ